MSLRYVWGKYNCVKSLNNKYQRQVEIDIPGGFYSNVVLTTTEDPEKIIGTFPSNSAVTTACEIENPDSTIRRSTYYASRGEYFQILGADSYVLPSPQTFYADDQVTVSVNTYNIGMTSVRNQQCYRVALELNKVSSVGFASNASQSAYPPLNNRDKITNICTIRRWSNVA